jgi:hypothetical protein
MGNSQIAPIERKNWFNQGENTDNLSSICTTEAVRKNEQ